MGMIRKNIERVFNIREVKDIFDIPSEETIIDIYFGVNSSEVVIKTNIEYIKNK